MTQYTGNHFAGTWREFSRYFPPEFRAQVRHHVEEHAPLDRIRMRYDCLTTRFVLPDGGNRLSSCPWCGHVDSIEVPNPAHRCSRCGQDHFPVAVVLPVEGAGDCETCQGTGVVGGFGDPALPEPCPSCQADAWK